MASTNEDTKITSDNAMTLENDLDPQTRRGAVIMIELSPAAKHLVAPFYLAVDVETVGPALTDAVIAVGFCLGDSVGNVISKRRYCMSFDETDIHPKKASFWAKNMDMLRLIQKEACHPTVAWEAIATWLDEVYEQFPSITILSDDPSFAVTRVTSDLESFVGRLGLRYSKDADDATVVDPTEQMKGLCPGVQEMINKRLHNRTVTISIGPLPDDHAQTVYYCFVLVNRQIERNMRAFKWNQALPALPSLVI